LAAGETREAPAVAGGDGAGASGAAASWGAPVASYAAPPGAARLVPWLRGRWGEHLMAIGWSAPGGPDPLAALAAEATRSLELEVVRFSGKE
ncbi:MAG: hypothetical protein HZA54_10740, partial [Planctomycetes bacterium]|nr:hypothetical protein [Planctomycetota bacterium]